VLEDYSILPFNTWIFLMIIGLVLAAVIMAWAFFREEKEEKT